jgi:hypothetical protein
MRRHESDPSRILVWVYVTARLIIKAAGIALCHLIVELTKS